MHDLVAFSDSFDQLVAPMRWMCIKEAHPEVALNLLNVAQKRCESRSASRIDRLARPRFCRPQIHPIICSVLADQIDLAHSFVHEPANLRDDRFRLPTAMFPAHLWDHAKAARVIAAFRNLHISNMRRRQPEARRIVIRDVTGSRVCEE